MFQGVEEETNSILLGIPGTKLTSRSQRNARKSQVGGNPTFYGASAPFDAIDGQPQCDVCSGTLQFVIQVYAPTDIDRTLYFYGCPKVKCSGISASWKVYRMQSTSSSASLSPPPPATTSKQLTSMNGPTIDWNSFCQDHTNKDDAALDADLAALLESRDKALLSNVSSSMLKPTRANAGGGKSKKKNSKNGSKSVESIDVEKVDKDGNDDNSYGLTVQQVEEPWETSGVNCDNDVEMQRRLATYLEDEDDESIKTIIKTHQLSSSSSPSRSKSLQLTDVDGDDVDDDEPEAFGRMVGREDDRSKAEENFFSRVSLQPKQILRYAFGGIPLWCTLPFPEGPSCDDLVCPYCKGERKFEMQLMPGLLDCMRSRTIKKGNKNTGARLKCLGDAVEIKEKPLLQPSTVIVDAEKLKVEENLCDVDVKDEDGDFERDDESNTNLVTNKPTEEQINQYMSLVGEDSLNFGVVAIWSCSASCYSGNGKQELVKVQGPADC